MADRSAGISGQAERAGRGRSSLHRIPVLVLTLACWMAASAHAEAADKAQGQLSVRDTLTAPGRQARVEARLVHTGLGQSGMGGEPLELLVGTEKPARAMTGGDGRAVFETTCRMRGTYPITVRVAGSPRVESPAATGTLACWERRRPILLVDLAALANEPTRPFGIPPGLSLPLGGTPPEAIPDAAEELKRLTDYFYNVIYLSWSPRQGWNGETEVRTWLQQAKFPVGLLITVDPGQAGLRELLDRLKADGWDNVKMGIGRTREFAETLVASRIGTVILPASSRDEEVPKKAHVVKNWREIRKKLRS